MLNARRQMKCSEERGRFTIAKSGSWLPLSKGLCVLCSDQLTDVIMIKVVVMRHTGLCCAVSCDTVRALNTQAALLSPSLRLVLKTKTITQVCFSRVSFLNGHQPVTGAPRAREEGKGRGRNTERNIGQKVTGENIRVTVCMN